jgi:hypothetical protein
MKSLPFIKGNYGSTDGGVLSKSMIEGREFDKCLF